MDIRNKLDQADRDFDSGNFALAFETLNEILCNKNISNVESAEALNLKGLIVAGPAPYLTEHTEDETGLSYFIDAYHYDPFSIDILFNIINSFTNHDMRQEYTRENKDVFIKAYKTLENELYDSLPQDLKELLENYTGKYQQFKHETS